MPSTKPPRITGIRPTRSERRPAGPTARAPAIRNTAGPSPRMPFDPGDRDDRHGAERDRELDHPRLEDEAPVRAAAALRRDRAHAESEHEGRRRTRPRRRVTDAGRARRRARRARRGRRRSPAGRSASSSAKTRPAATSPRVGGAVRRRRAGMGRNDVPEEDASARPSSASTRCTIVAVASAGPSPVSCRSDVNGIPEMRAPAEARRLADEQERRLRPRLEIGREPVASTRSAPPRHGRSSSVAPDPGGDEPVDERSHRDPHSDGRRPGAGGDRAPVAAFLDGARATLDARPVRLQPRSGDRRDRGRRDPPRGRARRPDPLRLQRRPRHTRSPCRRRREPDVAADRDAAGRRQGDRRRPRPDASQVRHPRRRDACGRAR